MLQPLGFFFLMKQKKFLYLLQCDFQFRLKTINSFFFVYISFYSVTPWCLNLFERMKDWSGEIVWCVVCAKYQYRIGSLKFTRNLYFNDVKIKFKFKFPTEFTYILDLLPHIRKFIFYHGHIWKKNQHITLPLHTPQNLLHKFYVFKTTPNSDVGRRLHSRKVFNAQLYDYSFTLWFKT